MQKIIISTVLLSQMSFFVFAADFSVNKVIALKPSVWLQQGAHKSDLNKNQELKPGDQIITGNSGQVEIQMGASITLLLYPDSETSIQPEEIAKSTHSQPQSLVMLKGKSCIYSKQVVEPVDKLDIKVGNSLVSALSYNYDFCIQREGSLSSVKLRNGSVQITPDRDLGVFILSEPGIKLLIDDDGSFDFIASDSEDSTITTVDKKKKNKIKNVSSGQPDKAVKNKTSLTQDKQTAIEINTTPRAIKARHNYNVYLFSTLDKAQAEQVNKRFHQGGLNSKIIIIERKGTSIYRIAVPDFKSLKEAQTFSKSVKGKLGISTTWIGHSKILAQ